MNPLVLLLLPLTFILSCTSGGTLAGVPCALAEGREHCVREQKHRGELFGRALYLNHSVVVSVTPPKKRAVRRASCRQRSSSVFASSTETLPAVAPTVQPLALSTDAPPPASTSSAVPPPPSETATSPAPPPPPATSIAAPTPPPALTQPSIPPATPSGGTSQSDIDEYLSDHNSVRAQHSAAALTWNDTLASAAQQWANGCVFQHSGGTLGPYGENLASGTGSSYGIDAAIQSWTGEVSQYDPSNPQASHFTQVVWKATQQVGCALQECNGIFDPSFGEARYYVCEYFPQGNVIGDFAQNVQV